MPALRQKALSPRRSWSQEHYMGYTCPQQVRPASSAFGERRAVGRLERCEKRVLSRLHNKFWKSERNRDRMPAGGVSAPWRPRRPPIPSGLKPTRRCTECQLQKRKVKRTENAALHHE